MMDLNGGSMGRSQWKTAQTQGNWIYSWIFKLYDSLLLFLIYIVVLSKKNYFA